MVVVGAHEEGLLVLLVVQGGDEWVFWSHFQTATFPNVSRLRGVEFCLLSQTTSPPTVEGGRRLRDADSIIDGPAAG